MLFSHLSFFQTYLLLGFLLWPLFLLATVAMAGLALAAVVRSRRWLAAGFAIAAVVAAIPVVHTAFLAWEDMQAQQRRHAVREAHRWTLTSAQTVAGMTLPAGSVLQLYGSYDMTQKRQAQPGDISFVELTAPTRAFGARVRGRLAHVGDYWKATLAGEQIIAGTPCQGEIRITSSGELLQCTLSHSHALLGYEWPSGTTFDFTHYWREIRLPAPDGSILTFASDTRELSFCVDGLHPSRPRWSRDESEDGTADGGMLQAIGILTECRTADM